MKIQPMIHYGFKSFNGIVWSDYAVEAYNRLTKQINSYSQLNGKHCEQLLNARHRHFVLASDLFDVVS